MTWGFIKDVNIILSSPPQQETIEEDDVRRAAIRAEAILREWFSRGLDVTIAIHCRRSGTEQRRLAEYLNGVAAEMSATPMLRGRSV